MFVTFLISTIYSFKKNIQLNKGTHFAMNSFLMKPLLLHNITFKKCKVKSQNFFQNKGREVGFEPHINGTQKHC